MELNINLSEGAKERKSLKPARTSKPKPLRTVYFYGTSFTMALNY